MDTTHRNLMNNVILQRKNNSELTIELPANIEPPLLHPVKHPFIGINYISYMPYSTEEPVKVPFEISNWDKSDTSTQVNLNYELTDTNHQTFSRC